jgi:hypothetical protein
MNKLFNIITISQIRNLIEDLDDNIKFENNVMSIEAMVEP